MTEGLAALLDLGLAIGRGDAAGRDGCIRRVASLVGAGALKAEQVEELLLQSYLFAGYPAALNAIAAWRQESGRTAPDPVADDPELWRRRGAAVCERIYGGQYERLRRNVASLHPDMERWMVTEGYGKVLGRPGAPLEVRELFTVALLAGQDAAPQLYSHLRGALNAGVDAGELEATVRRLAEGMAEEQRARVEETWSAVRGRSG